MVDLHSLIIKSEVADLVKAKTLRTLSCMWDRFAFYMVDGGNTSHIIVIGGGHVNWKELPLSVSRGRGGQTNAT